MEQPQANDVILGGQTPPPIASAILGGIVGLQQQLTVASSEQRSQLLATALNYGEAGINQLITTLNSDPVLLVRATAYQLLQSVDSEKAKEAIANGILLNPGDKIYCVLESAITYGDDWYSLRDYVSGSIYWINRNFEQSAYIEPTEDIFTSEQDINEIFISNHYDYHYSLESALLPEDTTYTEQIFDADGFIYINLEQPNDEEQFGCDYDHNLESALLPEDTTYTEPIFDTDGFIYINLEQPNDEEQFGCDYEIQDNGEPLDWFEEDTADPEYDPSLISRHIFKETAEMIANSLHRKLIFDKRTPEIRSFDWWNCNFNLNQWCLSNKIPLNYPNNGWSYFDLFLNDLRLQPNHAELLEKLWIDTVGRLAFVYEEVIEKPVYLTAKGKL